MKNRPLRFIIIGLSVFLLMVFCFDELQKISLKHDVTNYLLQQGYSKDHIKSIRTYSSKAPRYSARVVFSDEDNIIYYYKSDKNGVRQFGTPSFVGGNEVSDAYKLKHSDGPFN
ncbi:DUF3139 domain-containing protein [Paenibacillus sp. GCM10023248]|uniref:DUF3139 domain-containing protein n=1 Tax=Bacillales TaxID=1385 RepID=UPI002379613B|nr:MULTISPECIES: DUF3139 domain-containing protein [Bacillales]MDD9271563.1 DUF3139 domain-containing protein [Paenibacillus sp. MAHUQ-63]MDR6884083.1 hypothetical protein [Bacillus sp. 3255]